MLSSERSWLCCSLGLLSELVTCLSNCRAEKGLGPRQASTSFTDQTEPVCASKLSLSAAFFPGTEAESETIEVIDRQAGKEVSMDLYQGSLARKGWPSGLGNRRQHSGPFPRGKELRCRFVGLQMCRPCGSRTQRPSFLPVMASVWPPLPGHESCGPAHPLLLEGSRFTANGQASSQVAGQ